LKGIIWSKEKYSWSESEDTWRHAGLDQSYLGVTIIIKELMIFFEDEEIPPLMTIQHYEAQDTVVSVDDFEMIWQAGEKDRKVHLNFNKKIMN
jgi:hypothetical protein